MPEVNQSITRRDFVQRFMRQCGMTYSQACRAYEAMCDTFEHGVVTASKVCIGRVGAIQPIYQPPREFTMHFKVGKGRRIVRCKRQYSMGGRYVFKFELYRNFVDTHSLRWFADEPNPV